MCWERTCLPYVIEHLANGDLRADGVVSSIYSLDEWEEAFDKATGKDGDFKVAFKF